MKILRWVVFRVWAILFLCSGVYAITAGATALQGAIEGAITISFGEILWRVFLVLYGVWIIWATVHFARIGRKDTINVLIAPRNLPRGNSVSSEDYAAVRSAVLNTLMRKFKWRKLSHKTGNPAPEDVRAWLLFSPYKINKAIVELGRAVPKSHPDLMEDGMLVIGKRQSIIDNFLFIGRRYLLYHPNGYAVEIHGEHPAFQSNTVEAP